MHSPILPLTKELTDDVIESLRNMLHRVCDCDSGSFHINTDEMENFLRELIDEMKFIKEDIDNHYC